MIAYDTTFDPPAPILQVTVANVLNRRWRLTLPAILDTAADITAIPEFVLHQIKAYPVSKIRIEGVDAQSNIIDTYRVQMVVAEQRISRLPVIPVNFEFVVLARDVLNQFVVHLDGPKLIFTFGP